MWLARVSERKLNPHAADLRLCARWRKGFVRRTGQRLVDVSEDARERAGRAHVGVMADVRQGPRRFDVRPERALLAAFAQWDEHDQQLRHQGQTAAEATKPVQT